MKPEQLYASPNALVPHYTRFRVGERLLLTGHSHQAWPDRAFDGQLAAFTDAAEWVDAKWDRALEVAARVRSGFAAMLGDTSGSYALGSSTHELLVRFLSALPLRARPKLVTTDGEFHSLRRQLARLAEEGVDVVRVAAGPPGSLGDRLLDALDERTAAVLTSAVFFDTGEIADGLGDVLDGCQRHGAELLVDAYHALNVVPFRLPDQGLADAYVVGGGYKYLQMGEGNCFLRVPPGRAPRPVVTGWYAEFERLADASPERVDYGSGAAAFGGATYDPTSHYRAATVFDFFAEMKLDPVLLREVSQHQLGLLIRELEALDLPLELLSLDHSVPLERRGGFLALRSPEAARISAGLHARGVLTDARGDVLRLGPAPYLSDAQLHEAVALLGEVVLGLI